jgi:hypothetical protein
MGITRPQTEGIEIIREIERKTEIPNPGKNFHDLLQNMPQFGKLEIAKQQKINRT